MEVAKYGLECAQTLIGIKKKGVSPVSMPGQGDFDESFDALILRANSFFSADCYF